MAELSGLQVFKYLPAAKKLPEGNCKKCSCPTCMAFALKLAKGQTEIELCPYVPDELKEIFSQSMKKPQKEVYLGHKNKVLVGGENVLFRHDKTFINKTAIGIVLDTSEQNWEEKLKRINDFDFSNNRIKIIETEKTNSFIEIPIHPQLKEILEKRKGTEKKTKPRIIYGFFLAQPFFFLKERL